MNHSTPRILIIDDSPIDRMMLEQLLIREGFQIITAVDGSEGLEKARQHPVDLILLDVVMPDENGFETCKKLKHDNRTNSTPVIFLSASNDPHSRVVGLTCGAVDYISKPFEITEVLARIRIHIRIRRAMQAVVEQQQAQLYQLQSAQQAILVRPEELPDACFAIHYRPLNGAGGDFYDVISLGEGITGYFSADIAGHDFGAAFVTSALKALLRQNFNNLYTLVETMTLLNEVLHPVLPEGVLLCACSARLNRRARRLELVFAGHPPVFHLKVGGGLDLVSGEGDLLGAFSSPQFEMVEIPVNAGDRLFLFSDGLIETYRGSTVSRKQGITHLGMAVREFAHRPLQELVDEAAYCICPLDEQAQDDIQLLGVEV